MKRLFLLSFVFSLCCLNAMAQEYFEVDGIAYYSASRSVEWDAGGFPIKYETYCQVTQREDGEPYDGAIVIPETVNYYGETIPVREIANNAFQNSLITSVTLPTSITNIKSSTFYGCSSLTSINLPEGITSIESKTFYGCSSLKSITLPSTLTSIVSDAFSGCSEMTEFVVNANNQNYSAVDGVLYNKALTEIVYVPQGVTSVKIPNGVTTIAERAFSDCKKLTFVSIPGSVTSIDGYAFYNCTGIPSLIIPESVTSVGEYAFYNCTGISSLIIPGIVTFVGQYAFNGIETVTFKSATVPEFGVYMYTSGTKIYNIGNEWTIVPQSALADYRTALNGHEPATIIGDAYPIEWSLTTNAKTDKPGILDAMGITTADNPALNNVVKLKIKGTINSYDFMVMRNKMPALRWLDLSEADVVYNAYEHYTGFHSEDDKLPAFAFYKSKFYECILPESINSIDNSAFASCDNLEEMVIPNSVTYVGDGAFSNCAKLKAVDYSCSGAEGEGTTYLTRVLEAIAFYGCDSLQKVSLPEGLTVIKERTFYQCNNLETINFPEKLTEIGNYAFSNCSLKSIKLPVGLRKISNDAFSYNPLKEVHIPSSVEYVGYGAFAYCGKLRDVYTYVVQPVNIDQYTFEGGDIYAQATLHVPETAYDNYWMDTQWSLFQNLVYFDEPYEYFYLGKDFTMDKDTPRLDGVEDENGNVTPPDADLKPGSGLIVEGNESQDMDDVHLQGDGEGNSGSLIGDGTQNGGCNININKLHIDINIQSHRWYFFAFPFDIDLSDMAYEGSYVWREYDGATRAEHGSGGWKNVTDTKLKAWKGYIFQGNVSGTLTLTIPNVKIDSENRDVTLDEHVATDEQNASWNFVGNPYFNYFDINDMDYDQPITIWNGKTYESYRKGDDDYVIHPFQGYFVQKPSDANKIHYNAEHRQTKTQSEAKTAAEAPARRMARMANVGRKLINLALSDSVNADKTRIVFNAEAKADYETSCDAAKFIAAGVPQLYSVSADKQTLYSINERPEANGTVDLGFQASKAGEYTLAADRDDVGVMLKDKLTGATHYFHDGAYRFTTEAGTFDDRFMLVKMSDVAVSINGVCTAGDVLIMAEHGKITVSRADGKQTTVTGVNGAAVGTISGNGSLNVAPGLYVVTVDNHVRKIMVK